MQEEISCMCCGRVCNLRSP